MLIILTKIKKFYLFNRETIFEHETAIVTWPSTTFVPILRQILKSRLPEYSSFTKDFVRLVLAPCYTLLITSHIAVRCTQGPMALCKMILLFISCWSYRDTVILEPFGQLCQSTYIYIMTKFYND